jgi:hypothetical protein
MFVNLREFTELPPQFQRYYHVAEALDEAEHQYRTDAGPFASLAPGDRLKMLVEVMARILADELRYWHAKAGRSPMSGAARRGPVWRSSGSHGRPM